MVGPWELTVLSVGVKLKVGGSVDLLIRIESIHNRYENLETLTVFSYELRRVALSPHSIWACIK